MTARRLKVLIVDDEEMIIRLLKGYLEDSGFEVMTAKTGEEGLRHLAAEPFDAAIVDVRLPDMGGEEVVLKGVGIRPLARFFIHTGSIEYMPSEALRAAGVDDESVIRKPVLDMADILRLIEKKAGGG